jgi:hypothetical protein
MANSLPRKKGIIFTTILLILIGLLFISKAVINNNAIQMTLFGIYNVIGSKFTFNKPLRSQLWSYMQLNYFRVKFQQLALE